MIFIRAVKNEKGISFSDSVFWKGNPTDFPSYHIPDSLLPEQLIETEDSGWLLLYHDGHTCYDGVTMDPVLNGQVHYLTTDQHNNSFPLKQIRKQLRD